MIKKESRSFLRVQGSLFLFNVVTIDMSNDVQYYVKINLYIVVAKIEQMFYNNITGKVIAMNEREDEVLEMTNEEYRVELQKIFDNVNSNRILRYFYILLPKLIKEWQ